MKNRIVVLLSLILGFTCCFSGAVMAAESETKVIETDADKKLNEGNEKEQEETTDKKLSNGLANIQIPEEINVVIDPWEIDQKGQIYSKQYVIKNTGNISGVLTLSDLSCKPGKHSGVIVKTDKKKLHDNKDKAVYIEMLFGNGDQIVFTQKSSEYQTELKPGEELSVRFAGEVNENADKKWGNGDIAISAIYSWDALEDSEINPEKQQTGIDTSDDGATVIPEKETSPDGTAEEKQEQEPEQVAAQKDEMENAELQETLPDGTAEEKQEPEAVDSRKDEVENIELQEPQSKDIVIDSWKTDENGRIISQQYVVQNTGEIPGILNLSEVVCKPKKEGEVAIKTEKDELHESEETSVYMELLFGNGEKMALSQENAQYKVVLEPGEGLSICCAGEMNGNLFENQKEGDIVVSATCTWSPE